MAELQDRSDGVQYCVNGNCAILDIRVHVVILVWGGKCPSSIGQSCGIPSEQGELRLDMSDLHAIFAQLSPRSRRCLATEAGNSRQSRSLRLDLLRICCGKRRHVVFSSFMAF